MVNASHRSGFPTAARTAFVLFFLGFLVSCAHVEAVLAAKHPTRAACSASVPELFDRVSPSVVFIAATTINPYQLSDRVSHIVGTGFIYDASGLILTNSHMAFGRQSIMVTLDDGTSAAAQLVGADPIFDVAVLRIAPPPRGKLPTAVLGDSDRVRIGEEVLAIGNPLGLDQSVTRGIVSAMNRILPETPFSLEEPVMRNYSVRPLRHAARRHGTARLPPLLRGLAPCVWGLALFHQYRAASAGHTSTLSTDVVRVAIQGSWCMTARNRADSAGPR
jgi:hypothetical protein